MEGDFTLEELQETAKKMGLSADIVSKAHNQGDIVKTTQVSSCTLPPARIESTQVTKAKAPLGKRSPDYVEPTKEPRVETPKPTPTRSSVAHPIKLYYSVKSYGSLITYCGYNEVGLEGAINLGVTKIGEKRGPRASRVSTFSLDNASEYIGFLYCKANKSPVSIQLAWFDADTIEIKGVLLTPALRKALNYIVMGSDSEMTRGMHDQNRDRLPLTPLTSKDSLYEPVKEILATYRTLQGNSSS